MVMSRVCLLNLFFFSFLFPSNNLDSSLRNLFLVCPLYASSFLKLHYVFLLPLISYIYFQVRIKTITLCRTRQKLMIIQKKGASLVIIQKELEIITSCNSLKRFLIFLNLDVKQKSSSYLLIQFGFWFDIMLVIFSVSADYPIKK